MTLAKFSKLLFSGAFLLAGLAAQGNDAILQVKDWTLRESGDITNGTCSISTSVKKGFFKSQVFTLEIVKLKDKPQSPVEVLIRVDQNKQGSTGFQISLPTASSEMAFARLSAAQPETFWGIGKNTSALLSLLKSKESLETRGIGGKDEVSLKFSPSGFPEVLVEMEKRCNGSTGLVNPNFEVAFFSGVASSIDPTHIALDTTNQLRSIYFQAYSLVEQTKVTQAALNLVLAKYQPFIDEQIQVRATLQQIQGVDLPNSRTSLAAAQKQQADATTEIARLNALIPGLQTQVQQSQQAYNDALAILAPLEPEYNRLSQQLNGAQNSLNQAQSRLSQIDDRLSDLESDLRSLQAESDSLRRATSQERFDLDNARSYLNQTERERANFNVSYERDQRLRNNNEYRRMNDERNRLIPSAQQVQRDLSQARRERDRIAQLVNTCHATPDPIPGPQCTTGSFCNPEGEKINWSCGCGPVSGGVDQGGGCYHVPTHQQCNKLIGTLLIDCTSLENSLASAQRDVSNLESTASQIQYRLNDLNNRISDIENQVSNEVQREYRELVDREQQARQRVSTIEDALRRDESRLAQILNSEIPNREREQASLSSERPRVLSEISQASSAVDSADRQLAAFRASTDWDRKKASFDKTNRDLSLAQKTLATAQSQKGKAESSLQSGIADETQLKARIAGLEARVVSLSQRDQELVSAIAPLAAEREPLDTKLADLLTAMTNFKDQFLNLLR